MLSNDRLRIIGEQVMGTLEKYDYAYSNSAITKIVQKWYSQKRVLIDILSEHPNWDEDAMAVAFDYDTCREIDSSSIINLLGDLTRNFISYTPSAIDTVFLFNVGDVFNLNGRDYEFMWGCGDDSRMLCMYDKQSDELVYFYKNTVQHAINNYNVTKSNKIFTDDELNIHYNNMLNQYKACLMLDRLKIGTFAQVVDENIKSSLEIHLEHYDVKVKVNIGQKYSRVLNKIFLELKIPEMVGQGEYNRIFAQIADAINPIKITRHTLLSVHPCDYLLMSHGTGWKSCHQIHNSDSIGEYAAGTLSYMLDEGSMVFYTVDSDYTGNDFYSVPKINRQMFVYGNGMLLQSRLYPSYNDHLNSTNFRNVVQKIITECLDVPNLWTLSKSQDDIDQCFITSDGSLHYADYEYDHYFPTMSIIKGEDKGVVYVGADALCVYCGYYLSSSEHIICEDCVDDGKVYCEYCGSAVDEEDAHIIDGQWYCDDCCTECINCEEYHLRGYINHTELGAICDGCMSDNYMVCECCSGLYHIDDLIYINDTEEYVCNDCVNSEFATCASCGEIVKSLCDDSNLCPECFNS